MPELFQNVHLIFVGRFLILHVAASPMPSTSNLGWLFQPAIFGWDAIANLLVIDMIAEFTAKAWKACIKTTMFNVNNHS